MSCPLCKGPCKGHKANLQVFWCNGCEKDCTGIFHTLTGHPDRWCDNCWSTCKHIPKPPVVPVNVAQQPHYTQFKIQPITFIHANNLSYSVGNVIKYVCRYKEKDGLKDLLKAKNYIDYIIQELETGEVKP